MGDGIVTVHWSGSGNAPVNDCTRGMTASPSTQGMLHMAVQGRSSGKTRFMQLGTAVFIQV